MESWRWERLERAVLALAHPAQVQLALFPDFVCKADELALDLEDALYGIAGYEAELPAEGRVTLQALGDLLLANSGESNADFWTEDALIAHPIWEQIRDTAKATVAALGWEFRPPPPSNAVYIGGA
ncbi:MULTISPECIES: hypothetical protein [unclassified Sphingomonas]|uniref:hypothetical protein n=1 Tax=unclassified Sphingomonas TaxID=196159 RepID=UPI002150FDE3|nr:MULTISPECIES: hypothetical protein [unclassified Sphingomonas]MCR5871843.1 hypothetical protein [Sphingomonas sp. J344]UUX99870.1 hypothetical protein LRS08_01565 [Sphingomonas sp. J315]